MFVLYGYYYRSRDLLEQYIGNFTIKLLRQSRNSTLLLNWLIEFDRASSIFDHEFLS